jgi:UDP-N-acetyl-D-galactosamine dehydrogenase
MKNKKIALIGLGYVGLPLAVEFGKKFEVIGFDTSKDRIDLLKKNEDPNLEINKNEFATSSYLSFSNSIDDIKDCNIYIVTVPTPIDNHKKPDLTALKKSSETVGSVLKKDNIVIYESTVYPGATEEFCVPILEKQSGLKFNTDFYCGYSPERINPGDKKHKLIDIKKVTAGSTPEIALEVDELYKEIIVAGTYKAENIKVAEAAKVIENTQRDLNIALINELALYLKK